MSVTQLPAWQALAVHAKKMKSVHMRDLFASDPNRFQEFSIRFQDLLFDYSKNRITKETMH
jgi:glucose-6-phosphate isomerase